ncbi:MAG: hypothetical protein ACKVG0_14650 [Alphaproteobacteria bacterium]|jgi:hypothetical protein
MGKKSSGKLSEREIARRREQATARAADAPSKQVGAKGKPAGKQPAPGAKQQFRHQGR